MDIEFRPVQLTEENSTQTDIQFSNLTSQKFLSYNAAVLRSLVTKLYQIGSSNLLQILEQQIKQHKISVCKRLRNLIANFELHFNYCDYHPLLSFLRTYMQDTSTVTYLPIAGTNMLNGFFFDKNTGWIVKFENRNAIKVARRIYVQYFWNRRAGKRYIFGLKPNGKTILIAILTHVSAPYYEQKHESTKQAVRRALFIVKRDLYPVQQALLDKLTNTLQNNNQLARDKAKLSSLLQKFQSVNQFRPYILLLNYYRIDQIALNKYWKHPHDKIRWFDLTRAAIKRYLYFYG